MGDVVSGLTDTSTNAVVNERTNSSETEPKKFTEKSRQNWDGKDKLSLFCITSPDFRQSLLYKFSIVSLSKSSKCVSKSQNYDLIVWLDQKLTQALSKSTMYNVFRFRLIDVEPLVESGVTPLNVTPLSKIYSKLKVLGVYIFRALLLLEFYKLGCSSDRPDLNFRQNSGPG